MAYATQQAIIDRYGHGALLLIADRNQDGVIDTDVVERALSDASAEVDTYVAAKYSLPLPSTPEVLVRLCVDIIIYRLSSDAGLLTEERRKRYEDAVSLLRRIASGDVSLGMLTPPESSNGVVAFSGPERRFGRGQLL